MNLNYNNSYGTFYNKTNQIININASFIFLNHNIIKNIHHNINTQNIKILEDGIYLTNIFINLTQVGQVALFINDKLYETTEANINTNNIIIHEIIMLKKFDIITLRNHNNHDELCCTYLNLVLWKIDDLDYTNSDSDSNSSSTDTELIDEHNNIENNNNNNNSDSNSNTDSDSNTDTDTDTNTDTNTDTDTDTDSKSNNKAINDYMIIIQSV